MTEMTKNNKKKSTIRVAPSDSDEAAMARFAREHPEYAHTNTT
jgi:hypothetical protein